MRIGVSKTETFSVGYVESDGESGVIVTEGKERSYYICRQGQRRHDRKRSTSSIATHSTSIMTSPLALRVSELSTVCPDLLQMRCIGRR